MSFLYLISVPILTCLVVVISNRLVTSPCAIVVDSFGYSANMEKLLTSHGKKSALQEYATKQKVLEINPRSPLVEGLLKRVMALPIEEAERDKEEETELKEVVQILIDGALIRSGFEVMESNMYVGLPYSVLTFVLTRLSSSFFERVDRALRRSLGVSETAKVEVEIAPAPPKAETAPAEMDEVSTNAADFIEMQDFRASLAPELDRTFGGPKLMKMDATGPKGAVPVPGQVAFDADDVRKRMEEGEDVNIDEMVAEALKSKTKHTEL